MTVADPFEDAAAHGLRVEVAELGDWSPVVLLSEYDRAARTIRVCASAVRRVRAALGDRAAGALIAAAVGHELYHHEVAEGRLRGGDRAACERDAERYARRRYGATVSRFDGVLR